jgi:hypothetical protein
MSLRPDADFDMGGPSSAPPASLLFGPPPSLLSPPHATSSSMAAPSSPVVPSQSRASTAAPRPPSVARSEAGDIIVSTAGREESLSRTLGASFPELGEGARDGSPSGGEEVLMDVDEGGKSDAETLGIGSMDEEADSREGSVGKSAPSA